MMFKRSIKSDNILSIDQEKSKNNWSNNEKNPVFRS